MEKSCIHILGIAPYEGMKNVMERAAENYPNVQLDVAIGDLDEGVSIVQNAPKDYYDCIISRGGTADRIRQVSNIPVVDIKLSVYDVLRSIKLAENYGGRYAIVGFPSITDAAHTLCDLLRYDVDIITVHNSEDVVRTLTKLHQDGYRMVVSDMVTHTIARQMGMDAFLINSGAEGLRMALDQAIVTSTSFRQLRWENIILRYLTQGERENSVVLLNTAGNLCYASPADPPPELLSALRSHQKDAIPGKTVSFYYKNEQTLYWISVQRLQIIDKHYYAFCCRPGKIPLRGAVAGIRSYGQVECEYQFMNSFYSISGALGEADSTVSSLALSRQSVLISGEAGTGKEQIARALYLRSPRVNTPLLILNCKLLTDKGWNFLLNHSSSPFNDANSTLFFQHLESIPEERITQLQSVIQETGLAKRQRLIFSYTYRQGENLPEQIRTFSNEVGCIVLNMPPLRTRADEIPSLAILYLNSLNQEIGKQITGFDPGAIDQLRKYKWPNNYTQFKHVLHELAVLCESSYIRSSLVAELLAKESRLNNVGYIEIEEAPPEGTLDEIIRNVIVKTVAAHGGNQSAAARQLGIGRTTLWRYLNEHEKKADHK